MISLAIRPKGGEAVGQAKTEGNGCFDYDRPSRLCGQSTIDLVAHF